MNRPVLISQRGNFSQEQLRLLAAQGFSVVFVHDVEGVRSVGEVPLRDHFAGQALQAWIIHASQFDEDDRLAADKAAQAAYIYADAMLKAREPQ